MKGHHILGFNLHVFDVGEVEFKPDMQDGSSVALREMKSTEDFTLSQQPIMKTTAAMACLFMMVLL